MSRIEKGKGLKEELEQMRGEMKKEIATTKTKKHFLSCSAIFFFAIFLLFGWATWMVASTGLIDVPLVSALSYHKPEPDHLVTPGVPVEAVVAEKIQTALAQQTRVFSFSLTESTLTASLRSFMEREKQDMIDASLAQVSISQGNGLTFFFPLPNSAKKTAVSLSVHASAKDGILALTPKQFSIGSFYLPDFLVAFFLQPFIESALVSLNDELKKTVNIETIEYTDGIVVVKGKMNL